MKNTFNIHFVKLIKQKNLSLLSLDFLFLRDCVKKESL